MEVRVDIVTAGAPELEKMLKSLDAKVAEAMDYSAYLKRTVLGFLENAGIDLGLVGNALAYMGDVDAGLGHAARGLQGLHNASHEALDRFKKASEKSGGGGPKDPPPKP